MIHRISGRVIRGQAYGRKIGFPTANLDRREYLRRGQKIPFGVYAGTAEVGGKRYKAGIVIGPLDGRGKPKLEAHLLGFSGNLYGKKIQLELKKFLRKFKKYKDSAELQAAIKKDINQIKKI